MVYSFWFIVGVFLANGIGCVLTVFCLVRMTDRRRSNANRAVLVAGAAWGIIEAARDDALFVVATAVHLRDDRVRFFLAPGLVLTVVSMLIAVAVLGLAAANPTAPRKIGAGVTVGLLTAGMIVQSTLSGRTGFALSIDAPRAAAIAVGFAAVAAVSVWLATGATARWAMATPIMVLAACLTLAQYLIAGEVTTDPTAAVDDESGLGAIQLIFFSAVTLGVRAIALTVLSMTDEGRVDDDRDPGAIRHADARF
ncbi:hypothetical protein [Dactylosporangium sp. CA-233914]|uniref:hypothetical protein n=1 Tax=Dactylosporangium sp. CA-233914 TaxID=3239934 RepID=UPI003D8B6AE1